jgi:hypothetical protein
MASILCEGMLQVYVSIARVNLDMLASVCIFDGTRSYAQDFWEAGTLPVVLYVCVCVYIYIYIYIYMYVCMFAQTHTYVCVCTCMLVFSA